MDTAALPTDTERDAFLRCRQKADYLLGWQAPVWLWLIDRTATSGDQADPVATGALFGHWRDLAGCAQHAGYAGSAFTPCRDVRGAEQPAS